MSITYEPYHVHTCISNCLTQPDSTMTIEDYAKAYAERDMHVLCMSEHGNRSDVWKQFEIAKRYRENGYPMTPLAACECYFVPCRDPVLQDKRNFHLILVAKNMQGLRQMNLMLSKANETGYYYRARVDYELLTELDYRNFLCTSACVGGVMKDPEADLFCGVLHEIFRENFYLEVQHHPQTVQVETNRKILDIYHRQHIPLIYGTDSHYINHEDALLRKELLLSSGISNDYEDDFDLFLPTPQEAYQMLTEQGVLSSVQIEEAMENTLQLRDFEGLSFTTEKKIPNSRPTLTIEQRNHLYKKTVCDGYIEKAGMPNEQEAKALHEEMNAVVDTGTADYFIGMKDVVDKGLQYGGRLTKTGRGSGVSFATNYALGFTSINRLKCPVKLYPERFISKERLASGALPDLDLNMSNVDAFEKAGKDIFGAYGCLPMIAFGTAKTLSAFKLLARARNLDFETSNKVSKQISTWEQDVKHAKENNEDDPDYNAEEDVPIARYVEEQYMQLIEDSKQYKGIITNLSPHPCAHLLLDKDIREEIGVVRVKAKTGNKDAVYSAYIDGSTADSFGYLKADFLKVDIVGIIAESFEAAGQPVMSVDELLKAAEHDERIWALYADGFTLGLNQCEKEKSTERVMRYKPKNVVELTAFIAGIRPGFKSMLETFVSRTRFEYGINALDHLLKTKEIPDSFLMFDEQILTILQAAGISAADSYVCVKAIKKKKTEKVASFEKQFKTGFTKYLTEAEHAAKKEANDVVDKVWTIINDAASYMFCAAHAYSMACDSLYGAYLKAHYPYAFYSAMLKTYDKKGNKKKIAQIVLEMKHCKHIRLIPGSFGQDNRDWLIDEEHSTISQSLSSVKFVSKLAAEQLYEAGLMDLPSFTDVLRHLQMNTCLNTRQIDVLISIGYFDRYGQDKKLNAVCDAFYNGKNKLTKTLVLASVGKRMDANRAYEQQLPNERMPVTDRLAAEYRHLGICLTTNADVPDNVYFIQEIEDKYGIRIKLYNVKRGTVGTMKCRRDIYEACRVPALTCIVLDGWQRRQKTAWRCDKRTLISNEYDLWIQSYRPYTEEQHAA